jgi:hypothetical protein
MWAPAWTARFEQLLQKYHGTVNAVFAAHTHNDNFQVIHPSSTEAMYVLISASISPVYNQNPSFRTVTFTDDAAIKDATVYNLTNLLYASSTTAGEWQREYSFSDAWKAQQIDAASLSGLYDRIRSDEGFRDEWLKLLNVSSSEVHLLPGSAPGLYCADEAFDQESYSRCYCRTVVPHSAPGQKP